eukprot:TRINITY_DN8271_c0_g2_i4.p1 TRINITY_DN8271_c0_g2~~TRINITY_DN8271_c0_g2_i4.p1  ORF type:complete len:122 (-),score=13.38 TRINITY_DN8271_c0_g2_i4:100-465(-)
MIAIEKGITKLPPTFLSYQSSSSTGFLDFLQGAKYHHPNKVKETLIGAIQGDPVWAVKTQTVNDLVDLSLNFFFILPLVNGVGIRVIDAPVLHPVAEGLFNFVIGWTFMFAPLIFTDCRRD